MAPGVVAPECGRFGNRISELPDWRNRWVRGILSDYPDRINLVLCANLAKQARAAGGAELTLSQKCQYAVRSVLELAKRYGSRPTTVGGIADAQASPSRFLELILRQLRQAGFVASRRGIQGGDLLAAQPNGLSAAQIIRSTDGEPIPVKCVGADESTDCPLHRHCAFMNLWLRARDAVSRVYDETSFRDLVDEERAAAGTHLADYCI